MTPPRLIKTTGDPRQLLHELQVHQVELEMQNGELLEARAGLEALLENYTNLYDFAPVSYFALAADGTIQLANLTAAALVGIERARLVGRPLVSLLAAEQRNDFTAFLKQVGPGPAKSSRDFRLAQPGQPARFVNLEAQRAPNGQSYRVAMMDITQRKQAEDKVRISEIRYRRLFEAAHDGVLLIDPETRRIVDANPFLTRLLGYRHDQLVGKELFEIGLLRDEAASQKIFRKLKRQHEVRYENLPLERRGGGHQDVEVVANLYQENGHAIIQCNIRDITDRKRAEDAIHRNEVLFSALIAQAPLGVYVVDAALRLQKVNPIAQQAFGKVQTLIGREIADLFPIFWPKPVAQRIVNIFRRTLKTGTSYRNLNFSGQREDTGVKEFYEWQTQRVTLPAGELGVVCFFNNISARRHAEAAARRLTVLTASNQKLKREIVHRQAVEQSLQESERSQSRLLEQAHEMQAQLRQLSRAILHVQEEERKRISRDLHDVIAQTLTGISLRLAALKKVASLDPQKLHQQITLTESLVQKSVDIVHGFARELRPTVLDDLGLVPALQSFLQSFAVQTGLRTQLTAPTAVDDLAIDHRTALFRVAQEALNNVHQHARARQVHVTVEKRGQVLRMKIKDDGRSFPIPASGRRPRTHRLGLVGMRERMEMVGGTLEIESIPGHGTTLQAEIPLAAQPILNEKKSSRQ